MLMWLVVFQYVQPSCVVISAKQDEQLSKKLHEYSMSCWLLAYTVFDSGMTSQTLTITVSFESIGFCFQFFFILFWGLWFHEHVLIYCILLFSGNLMCFSLEFQILPLLWVYWIFTVVWMLIVCENHKALLCPALLLHLIKKGCSGARSPAHTISVFSTSNKPKDSIFWSRRSLFFTSKNTNKLGQRFLTTLFRINLIMV